MMQNVQVAKLSLMILFDIAQDIVESSHVRVYVFVLN